MSTNFKLLENLSEDEIFEQRKKKLLAKINAARFDFRFKRKLTIAELTFAITGEHVTDNTPVVEFDAFLRKLLLPTKTQAAAASITVDRIKSLQDNPDIIVYPEQLDAAKQSLAGILGGHHLVEYTARTGQGKTFTLGGVISELHERGFFKRPFPCLVTPCMYLTAATAIVQTERVLHGTFGIPRSILTVTNYEDLRTKDACASFMERRVEVINGDEVENYYWRPLSWPKLLICDESHKLKNWPDSIQSKIIMNYADLNNQSRPALFDELYEETYLLRASATPGSRPSDFAVSLVAARIEV